MNEKYINKCLLEKIDEVFYSYMRGGKMIKKDQLTYLLNAFPYFVRNKTWLLDKKLQIAYVNELLKPTDPVGTTIAMFFFDTGTLWLTKS